MEVWLITEVYLSEFVQKHMDRHRIPIHVENKLNEWMRSVRKIGLEQTRLKKSYHDEPLHGRLEGLRSIRLTLGWRAYYKVIHEQIEFVRVERVDKHEY